MSESNRNCGHDIKFRNAGDICLACRVNTLQFENAKLSSSNINADLLEALKEARKFILSDYELSNNESHHDGHHIAKEAMPVWEKITAAIAKAEEAGG